MNLVGQHRCKSLGIANLIDTPEGRDRRVDVAPTAFAFRKAKITDVVHDGIPGVVNADKE